jgi:hypothetical protein
LGTVGGSPEIDEIIWNGSVIVGLETSVLPLDNQPPLKPFSPFSLKYPSILIWDSSGSPEMIGMVTIGLGNFRSAFG